MLAAIKSILGLGPTVDFLALCNQGALILDVRTPEEFKGGYIRGAKSIPVQRLSQHWPKVKKDQPIIVYCASGMRSAAAKRMLQYEGYTAVHNGGGYLQLQQALT